MTTKNFNVLGQMGPAILAIIKDKIGGEIPDWQLREFGDGNVNLIFCLEGPKGKILVKQAVPYLRCVGESWPLSLKRNFFEYTAFEEFAKCAETFLPKVYAYDEASSAMVMEFLQDHIILRQGMMQKIQYPHLASDIAKFMAQTLFFTSDLYLNSATKKARMKIFCDNTDLCKITEDLIFTDPYRISEGNRWTAPHLDSIAGEFRNDVPLQVAVSKMKSKFLTETQALIHGDLHSGSIMVSTTKTKVIDPEFAFYGPMGFDLGLLFANFFMSYFSQTGHGNNEKECALYETWILQQVEKVWQEFTRHFSDLWETQLKGDLLAQTLVKICPENKMGHEVLKNFRASYMQQLFQDSIQFAGCEMIRRILGLAHVADLDAITDLSQRANCETKALKTAREFLVNPSASTTIKRVMQIVQENRHSKDIYEKTL